MKVSSIQVERLAQIASDLRKAREKQSISLDEIAIKTFIPLRLLQAIDQGQVERLPEPVFVQGFIRRYADAVGLDGIALAKTFPIEPPLVDPPPVEPVSPQAAVATVPPRPVPPKPVLPQSVPSKPVAEAPPAPAAPPVPEPGRSRPSAAGLPLGYILAGSAVALLLAVGAYGWLNRPQETARHAQTEAIAPTSQPNSSGAESVPTVNPPSSSPATAISPAASPTASPNPDALGSPPAAAGAVEVAIDLRDGDSWMEVLVDGKTEFEGTLQKGTQKTWTAQKNLVLISGNAGAVYVTYNQGAEKKLGTLGQVKEMSFPPKEGTLSQTN